MPKKIAIIGGGLAGLSAAATLANQGLEVTVFEAGAVLGGRARGVQYKDMALDNGQHILLGAYQKTLNLMELAGVDVNQALTRLPLSLIVKNLTQQKTFNLKASTVLPAPIHILWGLFLTKGLDIASKLKAIHFLIWLKINQFSLKQDESVRHLLQRHHQPQTLIDYLWEPLCLAALNTPIAQASAQVFLNVLKDSFAQSKQDADLLLPKTDLTQLISTPLANYIQQRGGSIHINMPIHNIIPTKNGYQLNHFDRSYQFSHLVIACGPHQLKHLTQELPDLQWISSYFSYQPITTIYYQFDKNTKLPAPMIGAINSMSQWIFDRGQLYQQAGLIAVVISAHAPFEQSQTILSKQIEQELNTLFPKIGKALWSKVITEKKATFSCDAYIKRPENTTSYANLFLAGDYTQGDYPATIEGAIRSGIRAASLMQRTTTS